MQHITFLLPRQQSAPATSSSMTRFFFLLLPSLFLSFFLFPAFSLPRFASSFLFLVLTLYQVLEAVGVKDLSVYAEVPGAELAPDFFVEVRLVGSGVSKCCTCRQKMALTPKGWQSYKTRLGVLVWLSFCSSSKSSLT